MTADTGMNPEPMQSYSIHGRILCGKCQVTPQIVKADGNAIVTLTVACHGEKETRSIPKNDFAKMQYFFSDEAQEDLSHLVSER